MLHEDIEYFNIKMDRLCNEVVKELGYSPLLSLHDNLNMERKLVINFNLNERNTKYFKDMVDQSQAKSEAEFLRSLLSTYTNYHPFLREMTFYKNKFEKLGDAITKKYQIRIEVEEKILEVEPLGILRDKITRYAVLKYQIGKSVFEQKVKDIEILKILK